MPRLEDPQRLRSTAPAVISSRHQPTFRVCCTLWPSRFVWATIASALVALLAFTASAHASEQQVQQQFEQGLRAEQEGDYEQARQHYLAAYALVPSGPVAANLGFVEARLELWPAAAEHLTAALEQDLPAAARPDVEHALKQVLAHIGVLDITVSPCTAMVTVNDRVVQPATSGLVAYVHPGMNTIAATQPGFAPVKIEVPVAAGERAPVRLLLQALLPGAGLDAATMPEIDSAPARRRHRPIAPEALVAIAGGALTVGAVGLGTGYALARRSSLREADSIRDGFPPDPTHSYCFQNDEPDCLRLADTLDDASRQAKVANWSFVAAAGLAATTAGVALAVRTARKRRAPAAGRLPLTHPGPRRSPAIPAEAVRFHVTPTSIAASVGF
jgi:hypothetical protein